MELDSKIKSVLNTEKSEQCFFALIRHGERADCHYGKRSYKYDIPHDPPLTDKGVI